LNIENSKLFFICHTSKNKLKDRLLRRQFKSGKLSGSGGIFAGAGFGKSAGFQPEPEPKSRTALMQNIYCCGIFYMNLSLLEISKIVYNSPGWFVKVSS